MERMKKPLSRKTVFWLLGGLLPLAALVPVSAISSLLVRSLFVMTAVGCSLGSFFGLAGGWANVPKGVASGIAFAACFVLPLILPEMGIRILLVLSINGFLGYLVVRDYRGKQRTPPRAARVSMNDPDLTGYPGYGTRYLLVQSRSGVFFHLHRQDDEFRFHRIGSGLKGIPTTTLASLASGDDTGFVTDSSGLVLTAPMIDAVTYRQRAHTDPQRPKTGQLTLILTDRKSSYDVLGDLPPDSILSFFHGIPSSVEPQKRGAIVSNPPLDLSWKEWAFLPILKFVYLVLFLITVLASTLFLFMNFDERLLSFVCLLLPLVTCLLYARYPGLFSLGDGDRKLHFIHSTGVDLLVPLLIPMIALGIRSLYDYQVQVTIGVGLGCGLLFIATLVFLVSRSKRSRGARTLLFGIFLIGYIPFSTIQINCTWDTKEPVRFESTVAYMEMSESSRSSSYRLTLNLSDGRTLVFDVGKREYGNTSLGDKKIVAESTGLLGMTYDYLD
jgi:hypothetical protein